METKKCRQCGEIKPIEHFRKYYGGSTSSYTLCKDCEKINSRVKYLERKGDRATEYDKAELAKLYQLYELQRACGLRPPRRAAQTQSKLDAIIESYKRQANALPKELQEWLTIELTKEPEYYLDGVYEHLRAKYRPLLRVDASTLTPVYDESYAVTLEKILERFNDYEDRYYGGN